MRLLSLGMLALILFLSGCAAQIGATGAAVVTEGRALKDGEAEALIHSTCLMGIGAWARLNNPNQQVGAMLLCGGDIGDLTMVRAGNVTVELGE